MLLSQQRITARVSDLFPRPLDRRTIHKYIPQPYKYWVGSAREGIRQVLSQLRVEKNVKKVGVPAYTCQVVLEAVYRAGCQPMFYDSGVVAETSEIQKIITKVDVLIVTHNFGFLPDIASISTLCKKHKVILIEDCAQALGATYQHQLVGSFGDYAVYSFGISKNVGFCGGIISSKHPLRLSGLKKYPLGTLWKTVASVLVSPFFFHKYFYPFFYPRLSRHLGRQPPFPPGPYSCPPLAKRVVLHQLKRYDKIQSIRRRNGEYCLRGLRGVVPFVEPKNGAPAWLYFVLLSIKASALQKRLLHHGVDIGLMRTFRCLDKNKPKAAAAEKNVLAFALYRSPQEIAIMVKAIRQIAHE
ncbi:DegT/DnrJ/EryC1/StrS family aminotransferase [Candidatus Woesearchaeota archaeon]|nr:DegT/DnrJ/EryC1/StrS family aminotransferase [Candidatus Woesearchaeota archaeon]